MDAITYLNLNRFVVGYHGTDIQTAEKLVAGDPFDESGSEDEWLGHGAYFWEFAPKQAWWWAERKFKKESAVVGALIQLGNCLDLLDPPAQDIAIARHKEVNARFPGIKNARQFKELDCKVFNYIYAISESEKKPVDTSRAVLRTRKHGKTATTLANKWCFKTNAYSDMRSKSKVYYVRMASPYGWALRLGEHEMNKTNVKTSTHRKTVAKPAYVATSPKTVMGPPRPVGSGFSAEWLKSVFEKSTKAQRHQAMVAAGIIDQDGNPILTGYTKRKPSRKPASKRPKLSPK